MTRRKPSPVSHSSQVQLRRQDTFSHSSPPKTQRETEQDRESSFAFLCVNLSVGQRGRGPGKRAAGPPSLLADETLILN